MTRQENGKTGPETMLKAWMESTMDFWRKTTEGMDFGQDPEKTDGEDENGFVERARRYWANAANGYQNLAKYMSDPDTIRQFTDGVSGSPEATLKAADAMWKGLFALQQQFLEKAAGMASKTEAYKFEELDKDAFKVWTELYDKELRAFFNIPPLGLGRFYQERASRVLDRFNLFQAALSEFMYVTSMPMEKSIQVIQEKLAEMNEAGRKPEDFKDVYNQWVKVLEGHYMVLFKSPEYLNSLTKTMESFEEFTVARHKWLEDVFKTMPVPTQQDMDEAYKEIYLLKKELKQLKKDLKKRQGEV